MSSSLNDGKSEGIVAVATMKKKEPIHNTSGSGDTFLIPKLLESLLRIPTKRKERIATSELETRQQSTTTTTVLTVEEQVE